MNRKKGLSRTLLQVSVISVCFFLFLLYLYLYNNKYMTHSSQPVNGIFVISEEELLKDKTFYLIDGWEFYPNQLLTPSDFHADADTGFMQITSIGKYNNFSMGNKLRSPVGAATYRLVLSLPDTPQTYALYLNEIFSAYNLYIDDTPVCSMGRPDADVYTESIGDRTILFEASGNTTLLLSVSNYSHYYSGMTYPPLFGIPDAVERIQTINLIIYSALLTILLLCIIILTYLSISNAHIRITILLYDAACLFLFVIILYQILFSFITITTTSWYSLELLCIYAIYPLSVLMLNNTRGFSEKKDFFICTLLFLFCVIAFIYGLVPLHSQKLIFAFQYSARFVKLATAAYLLYHAIAAILYNKNNSTLLLSGVAVFSLSIFADRIFPLYEPIYGIWFIEYGMLFLTLSFSSITIGNLSSAYKLQITLNEEKRQLNRQLAIQKLHYQELTDKIEDSIKYRHDEKHRLNVISSLAENGDMNKLKQYLKSYHVFSDTEERTVLCLNLIVDAILQYYRYLCLQADIPLTMEIDIPSDIPISDIHLSSLFANLTENAYEACITQDPQKPYIHIIAKYREDTLLLRVENSITNSPAINNGKFLSTKHEGYGIGTQSVAATVNYYGGQLKYDITDTTFRISATIPT